MRKIVVFGDTVMIPENAPVSISVRLDTDGTVHQNYGREHCHLTVAFQTTDTRSERRILLALGSDGYGHGDPIRPKLFRSIHGLRCALRECRHADRKTTFDPADEESGHDAFYAAVSGALMDRYLQNGGLGAEDAIAAAEAYFAPA